MKKYIVISLAATLSGAVFTGCDFLENLEILQENPQAETAEGFMNTPEQIEAVLFSSYYQLRRAEVFCRNYHSTVETMADYCHFVGSYESAGRYGPIDATLTSRLTDSWNVLYRSIRFANTILRDAPAAKNTPPQKLTELLAEARFLRGFAYLTLAKAWGGVPLQTDENFRKSGDYNIPRSEAEDVFGFAAADLEFALLNLPVDQPVAGRPQRTTAGTVLTEIYLWMGEWDKARDTAKDVINSEEYSLVEVTQSDDFYNIFHPQLVTSTEEIFYLKYADGAAPYGSSHAAMLHGSALYFDGAYTRGVQSNFQNRFMANWSSNDLRRNFNIYTVTDNGADIIFNKKFLGIGATGQQSANDYTLYRYADLLLYYAEAECRANDGPTADALEKLNMVHRRAYGKPSGTPDPSVDFTLAEYDTEAKFLRRVFDERGYETCYEGKRYEDMKRMGLLAEVILDVKGIEVGEAAYLFPIPAEEFLYNKGMDVNNPADQNPGY